jgi:hypothetical protein
VPYQWEDVLERKTVRINSKLTELLLCYGAIYGYVKTLSRFEKREFLKWDRKRPDGVKTSDWPGFNKYIGKRPGE